MKLKYLAVGLLLVTAPSVSAAFCPICTVAIGAGLGLSRYLKIDDSISGIWIGAILMSSSLWFASYLKKKNKNTAWSILFAAVLYASTIIPLYYYDIIGHPRNQILGIDKLIFGSIIGTILFPFVAVIHKRLKRANGDKSYLPLQSTALSILMLLISSLAMYVIIKYI